MNPGKVFEQNISQSFKKAGIFYYKIKDTYVLDQMNGGSTQLNPFDAFAFWNGVLYCIEMKSTDSKSISVCLGPDDKGMLKYHQIRNLLDNKLNYEDIVSIVLINFRETEKREAETYAIDISEILKIIDATGKKSINISEIRKGGYLIDAKKLRTNYLYDVEDMLAHHYPGFPVKLVECEEI